MSARDSNEAPNVDGAANIDLHELSHALRMIELDAEELGLTAPIARSALDRPGSS